MKTPTPMIRNPLGAALALAVVLGACGRSEPEFFRVEGQSGSEAPATASAGGEDGIPHMVRPVIVEPDPVEAPVDTRTADAAADATPGRAAAERYMEDRRAEVPVAPRPSPPAAVASAPTPERGRAPATSGRPPDPPPSPAVARAPAPEPAAREDVRADGPRDPDEARALNRRAIALIGAGRPEEAIAVLERAVDLQPRDAEMLGNLGYAYMLAGEHGRARARFMEALDLAPTRSATWLNLGQTYAEMGQRDVAVDAVVKGYRYSSRKPSVRSALQRAATGQRFSPQWREAAGIALDRIGDSGQS